MKIFLVFKTHFDIGFTQLSRDVISQYSGQMLSDVIETCDATADMGKLRYVWTMPSWPLTVMQKNPEKREDLDRLVRGGQIAFHALPFTSHTDFSGMTDIIEGLRYAGDLAAEYDLPQPVSAKMTDVPGHGRILPTILAKAGIKFLHLGCNAYATPPDVPLLFFWEGPDGSRVLTMYSRGGYGSAMLPPEEWPYPVWMALMHTHDNCGPQSAELIRSMVAEAQESCPQAEIVCGTMDDFYNELSQCDLSELPVVTSDMADSWIHGVASYPAEVRTVRQTRRDLAVAEAAIFTSGGDMEGFEAARQTAVDGQVLFCEHTWGLDVKTWMDPMRVYDKKNFRARRNSEEYLKMEESWKEQAERADTSAKAAAAAIACAKRGDGAILNANGTAFTGWAEAQGAENAVSLAGKERVYVRDVAPFSAVAVKNSIYAPGKNALENHRYLLTLDEDRGVITELYDKKLGCILAKERDGVGVFSYQYDVYGIQEMTEYLRTYAYRFFDWGIRDNGKDNYPECPRKTIRPVCKRIECNDYTLTLHYTSSAMEPYGDGREIRVLVSLPPEGDELFVRVELEGKEATPYVESGSFCVPLAENAPRYRFNKNGDLIDPACDITDCANHALYCLESFACAENGKQGLCIVSHDAPVCAIGETGIYCYRKKYEAHAPILYFNLFNNMWGTNFPQWIRGDLAWDFTLFGYVGPCEGTVMTRALALDREPRLLPIEPVSAALKLPEGMQVVDIKPVEDGWELLLRDTALTERKGTLCMDGWQITATDLRHNLFGRTAKSVYKFQITPFGVYAFKLKKATMD